MNNESPEEFADLRQKRNLRVGLIRRKWELVRDGATCDRCKYRRAVRLGSDLTALCGICAADATQKREIERQRIRRSAMREGQ